MVGTKHVSTTTPDALAAAAPAPVILPSALHALAITRIATGAIFLWAFFDKLLGLHYSTATASAWVRGGSPTNGFLSHVEVGPLQGLMRSMAGLWWADTLFMAGLLGVGLAAVLGVALRPAAVAGSIMMAAMWAAEWPLAQFTSAGESNGSTNPIFDYHVIYALVLIVSALTFAGHVWGFGRRWAHLPFVARHAQLI